MSDTYDNSLSSGGFGGGLLTTLIIGAYAYQHNPVYQHGILGLAGAGATGFVTSTAASIGVGAGFLALTIGGLVLNAFTGGNLKDFLSEHPIASVALGAVLCIGSAVEGGRLAYTPTDKFITQKLSESARPVPQVMPARPMTLDQ